MSLYTDNEYNSSFSASKIIGFLLTLAGLAVILWTVAQIFQLFTHGSAFLTLDEIVPTQIELGKSGLLLPREVLIYGLPIWAFSVTTKIGLTLLRSGLEFVERPRKTGK